MWLQSRAERVIQQAKKHWQIEQLDNNGMKKKAPSPNWVKIMEALSGQRDSVHCPLTMVRLDTNLSLSPIFVNNGNEWERKKKSQLCTRKLVFVFDSHYNNGRYRFRVSPAASIFEIGTTSHRWFDCIAKWNRYRKFRFGSIVSNSLCPCGSIIVLHDLKSIDRTRFRQTRVLTRMKWNWTLLRLFWLKLNSNSIKHGPRSLHTAISLIKSPCFWSAPDQFVYGKVDFFRSHRTSIFWRNPWLPLAEDF